VTALLVFPNQGGVITVLTVVPFSASSTLVERATLDLNALRTDAPDAMARSQDPVVGSQPLIVATSSEAIIDNHSGIFTQPLLRFLIPYIALIALWGKPSERGASEPIYVESLAQGHASILFS
jgi:hypothetical protein